MMRPEVEETLCFTCQEVEPTHTVTRGQETFKVCEQCGEFIEQRVETFNSIIKAIAASQGGPIFQQVLGANLLPIKLTIKKGVA